ncbi:MAG TPA: M23 family metallopeptidase [bacterium]|nr:M23 family metallopeptidase [bacterium]
MSRWIFLGLSGLVLLGSGCLSEPITAADIELPPTDYVFVDSVETVVPVADYAARKTTRPFGVYVKDRVRGYHTGDDIEYADVLGSVPVFAIMEGDVVKAQNMEGHGGYVLIDHGDVRAVYSHLDIATVSVKPGDHVVRGQKLGELAADHSEASGGDRKHLHFAVYEGNDIRYKGFETKQSSLSKWLDPTQFLLDHGVILE